MIARIEGKLIKLGSDTALVQVGDIAYEVMLPGYCIHAISDKTGADIVLCTMQYYEGAPGGGNLVPRMVGFLNSGERDFFLRFVGVKGMGIRKALKAFSMPPGTIAAAIEDADSKILKSLPGVGNRMAEQIVAALKGKMQEFAFTAGAEHKEQQVYRPYQVETLEILVAWGEKRNESMELIELACRKHPEIKNAEELVPVVYRLKQGIEV
ncbi:MAG: Holliday junction branch migration protein RuvA [Phycisphaerae bacterium]|jgi:Holliday junction DNA helicase RuvA